jgi:hypothetical protein
VAACVLIIFTREETARRLAPLLFNEDGTPNKMCGSWPSGFPLRSFLMRVHPQVDAVRKEEVFEQVSVKS